MGIYSVNDNNNEKKRFNTQQFFFVFPQIHAVQKILPKMSVATEDEGKVELFYLMTPKFPLLNVVR